MRIIKFRQYQPDTPNRPWHYWGYVSTDNTFTGPLYGPSEQFTGLLDKTGKEIYEGDRVRRRVSGNNYDEGNWSDTFDGVVRWSTEGWYLHRDNGLRGRLTCSTSRNEVIGNIHSEATK